MTTVARPYAVAAFEYALAKKALPTWEAFLEASTLLTQDDAVQRLLSNPAMTSSQLASLYCDVLTQFLDAEKKNFINLLAENRRLAVLPGITELFKLYRAEHEKTLAVEVTSAIELDQKYQQKLAEALTKRLQRKVALHCHVDENILGGAIISAGDTVIDGSVRGKLNRLVEFISGIS